MKRIPIAGEGEPEGTIHPFLVETPQHFQQIVHLHLLVTDTRIDPIPVRSRLFDLCTCGAQGSPELRIVQQRHWLAALYCLTGSGQKTRGTIEQASE